MELKKDKDTDYVLSRKSKGVFNSTFNSVYTAFLHNIKLSGYKMVIKFGKDPLAVEQNKYFTKIVNIYIVSDLDAWLKFLLQNFAIKNCLFGATSIVNNSDKENYVYSGYGIAFDGKVEWSLDNGTARNGIICGVDNSSSSHSDNCRNNFLV